VVLVTAGMDYSKERQFRGNNFLINLTKTNIYIFSGLNAKIETEHKFAIVRGGQQVNILIW
jgi:hypothetical protein